ncbi:ATP-binding protein [Photobacterium leiognathi]|uniref:ATP-binding protein n=1 Tax=Photobacterium leiognathi TaxID=553611 RepID=UPI000D153D0B|nr:ATP-binding protein [Photobacterium leiognathi]PSW58618.1 ATPase [Photobacterium leiognathi subsp. mandapamensis]
MFSRINWNDLNKTAVLLVLYIFVTYLGVTFRDVIIETDTAMLLLLLNIVSGFWLRQKLAYVITAISIVAFHFFVLPEHNSFKFQNYQHIITFTVMAFSGVFAVKITQSQQREINKNKQLKSELKSNYELASELASLNESQAIAQSAIAHLERHGQFKAQIWLFSPQLFCLVSHQGLQADDFYPVVKQFKQTGQSLSQMLSNKVTLHPLNGESGLFGVLVIETEQGQLFNPILTTLLSLSLARSEANNALTQVKEANQLEQMRNTLLAAVSHDLKTPLGSIIGTATTLSDPNIHLPADTQKELLQSIAEEGYSLNRSLTKLLDISRYSIKTLVPKRDWVEPEEIIGSATKRVEQLVKFHPIKLTGETMLVSLDYALIEQIMANLIENAAKYSPIGAAIDISTGYHDGCFLFEIADRGCGVAPEDTQRIFERFYRSEHTKVKGTGLGLAICKLIVSAHNGTINVTSRAGGGSIFSVAIPCDKYDLADIYE